MNTDARIQCLLAILSIAFTTTAQVDAAQRINELIVFGDSNSDTGNSFHLTDGAAVYSPYYGGRFSNGRVWVERLAERLHLGRTKEFNPIPSPSLAGGTNYAYGGAETGPGTFCLFVGGARTCAPNIGTQIEQFFATGQTLDGDELIVVQGGFNNEGAHQAAVLLAEHVATLAAAGGELFLVPNLDRASQIPASSEPFDVYWDNFVAEFNATLTDELDALDAATDATIVRFDWLKLSDAIIRDPMSYGLTNVTDPACPECDGGFPSLTAGDSIVMHPDEYLYWDLYHYTTVAHTIFGDAAADLVETALRARRLSAGAVPEPPALLLLLYGAVLLRLRGGHRGR